jgi:competence protein ComEC
MLLAWVMGNALQLTQPQLGTAWHYVGPVCLTSGVFFCAYRWRLQAGQFPSQRLEMFCLVCAMATAAALAYASVGFRALAYQRGVLPPDLQGLDLEVSGKVVGLPQRQADGWRFRFQTSQAHRLDTLAQVELPSLLQLGWYTQDTNEVISLPVLQTGQHWRLAVRLKQPHGLVNPGGFDFELWM